MADFLSFTGSYDFAVRQALILTIVGLSVYVLLRAGLFAVPQVGFMAIGSYTSALLSLKQGWSFPVALVASALAAGAAGLLLGVLIARLNGIYLAIATIGFSEIVREIFINWDVSGGSQGLFGIPLAANDVYIVGCLLAALALLGRLSRTRFGLAMAGVREEPLMTTHQGVNIPLYRLALFGLSGVLAGLAGSLYVHQSGFIDPGTYQFGLLVELLAAVVLGGMMSVWGPVLGGVIVYGLPQVLGVFSQYRSLVNGAFIVVVVAVAPEGVAGLLSSGRAWVGDRLGWPGRPRRAATAPRTAPVPEVRRPTTHVVPRDSIKAPIAVAGRTPLLALSDIRKSFGGIRALQGVSLEVLDGEVFGLIGPNGSGKTSLINTLSGVYRPDGGEGALDGRPLAPLWGRTARLSRAGIARTFQGIRLLADYTVTDNVLLGAYHRQHGTVAEALLLLPRARRETAEARTAALELLDGLGLAAAADRLAGELPYGLQRKVEIARALASGPRLLLLDEPTAGMSPHERDEIFDLVQQVRQQGVTVMVIEHDVAVMSRHCDRMAVLNFGKVIAVGTPDSVTENREVIDAYIGRPAVSR